MHGSTGGPKCSDAEVLRDVSSSPEGGRQKSSESGEKRSSDAWKLTATRRGLSTVTCSNPRQRTLEKCRRKLGLKTGNAEVTTSARGRSVSETRVWGVVEASV